MSALLSATGITVSYPGRRSGLRRTPIESILALDHVDLEIGHRSALGLVGESGAGKSTLARVLCGLTAPQQGAINFDGRRLGFPRNRQEARAIQMVFQDPVSSLNPALTAGQVLGELLRFHHLAEPGEIDRCIIELLELVHLPARVSQLRPRQLSGGQRQRLAIARALAVQPRVLIADEAVSALDVSVQAAILNLFDELRQSLGLAIVMISHDLAVIAQICEEIAVMYDGRIVERGEAAAILRDPAHSHTRSLLVAAAHLH